MALQALELLTSADIEAPGWYMTDPDFYYHKINKAFQTLRDNGASEITFHMVTPAPGAYTCDYEAFREDLDKEWQGPHLVVCADGTASLLWTHIETWHSLECLIYRRPDQTFTVILASSDTVDQPFTAEVSAIDKEAAIKFAKLEHKRTHWVSIVHMPEEAIDEYMDSLSVIAVIQGPATFL